MKRFLAIPLLALVLPGCMKPSILSANRDEVIISHDPMLTSASEMQGQADVACARFGKKAVFVGHDFHMPVPQPRNARFECR